MASQDYYEGQTWKNHPGASNLLSWCVRNIDVSPFRFVALLTEIDRLSRPIYMENYGT